MSKQCLNKVFAKLTEYHTWSLQVVQVKNSKKYGTSYICREVEIIPAERLLQFIKATAEYYSSDKGIAKFTSVDEYAGDVVNHIIYKLDKSNPLICHELEALIMTASNPDKEISLSDMKPNAALYRGVVPIDDVDVPVMLVSMQKPISVLNNRFLGIQTDKFKEIDAPVLTLRKTIDVAIIGDSVYLLSLAGENLFNIERAYKAVCKRRVEEITKCDFLSDIESFKTIANSGGNPRRFIAFNSIHFEWLNNYNNRKSAAAKFGFLLEGDSINTKDPESVGKLIKFLCNKAMIDPCDESPVEVANTKPWS